MSYIARAEECIMIAGSDFDLLVNGGYQMQ